MPVNAYYIFAKGWFASQGLCIFFAAFRYITIYAEWMIVSTIALNKCIHFVRPKLGHMIFSGVNGHFIVALIWTCAILAVVFVHFQVIFRFLNCLFGLDILFQACQVFSLCIHIT